MMGPLNLEMVVGDNFTLGSITYIHYMVGATVLYSIVFELPRPRGHIAILSGMTG